MVPGNTDVMVILRDIVLGYTGVIMVLEVTGVIMALVVNGLIMVIGGTGVIMVLELRHFGNQWGPVRPNLNPESHPFEI